MSGEEIIEILREFEQKRVDELPEDTQRLFYAIMKIADERDMLLEKVRQYEMGNKDEKEK